MSQDSGTKIFFFKSHPLDLVAVENYLIKRDYNVMSEHDLKDALVKVIQFDPAFIFLAWDHPHEKAHTIPRFISQSISGMVIPYIKSTSKDMQRSLDSSGFTHRIYPPISGPGIIRTILKLEKELNQKLIEKNRKEMEQAKISNFSYIPGNQTVSDNVNNFLNEAAPLVSKNIYTPENDINSKSNMVIQKGTRGELLKNNQNKLKSLSLKKLDQGMKNTLKEDFQNTIKNKIEDSNQTHREDGKSEIVAESYQRLLCLIVQSDTWCGYLLVSSQLKMNNSDYHSILQGWLQKQFINMNEISELDYFEINLEITENIELKEWAKEKADYLELFEIDSNEVLVSFFSIDPKFLIIEINDSNEMLEVPIDFVKTDQRISLSLFLHLPDNKKYILYTPANQILSGSQKNKLVEKMVEKLYTPLDFEKELNQMKAEVYLNESFKQIKKLQIT